MANFGDIQNAVAIPKTFTSRFTHDFDDGKLCVLTQVNGTKSIWLKGVAFLPKDEGVDYFLTIEAG